MATLDAGSTIAERMQELLDDAKEQASDLAKQRNRLQRERDKAIAKVKEDFAKQIAEVDEQVKVTRRLEAALRPDTRRAGGSRTNSNSWSPSQEKLDVVMTALQQEKEATIPTLARTAGVSRATVGAAMKHFVDSGQASVVGTGPAKAQIFAPVQAAA